MLTLNQYYRAASFDEALSMLQEGSWKILGGGTDIIPQMRAGIHKDANLLDIQLLKNELGHIIIGNDTLSIGALCTHEDIRHHDLVKNNLPSLAEACAHVGSPQIRKRGTLAGNIINASPAADSVPSLVASGAQARFVSKNGERLVMVEDIALRPGRTVMDPSEILTEIIIPLSGHPWQGCYEKVGVRNALQISVADCAILIHPIFGVRIACGSVGPTIRRCRETELVYSKKGMTRSDFEKSLAADISPIDDIRASAEYRREVLTNLIYAHYQEDRGENV